MTLSSITSVVRRCVACQPVSHYHTPSRDLTAYTHILLYGLISSVLRVYLSIFQCRCIFFFLLEGRRTSGVVYSFHFLPIFLLAQIL